MADFIPAFEGEWDYQSFVVTPTPSEIAAPPGSPATARKWAKGKLRLADGVEMEAAGVLEFLPGVELQVQVHFVPGADGAPAEFEATGTGVSGPMAGVEYHLAGWAIPSPAGQLIEVRGAVRSVRGGAAGLGGMPPGTVGSFVMVKSD